MDLYIIRHAWAGHHGDPKWPDDALRPLTPEGKERFANVVGQLAGRGLRPEIVATSPLKRCVETAEIVASGVGKVEVIEMDVLKPGGSFEKLLAWTLQQARTHEKIAWVGHAPEVNLWTAAMIGGAEAMIHFAKGGIAAVRFDGLPAVGAGELRWMVSAKVLGC